MRVHLLRNGVAPGIRGQVSLVSPPQSRSRDKLLPAGATFTARRAKKELSSRLPTLVPPVSWPWPDGALYICDMYRDHRAPRIFARGDSQEDRLRQRRMGAHLPRREPIGNARDCTQNANSPGRREGPCQIRPSKRLRGNSAPVAIEAKTATRLSRNSKSQIASQIANSPVACFHALHILEARRAGRRNHWNCRSQFASGVREAAQLAEQQRSAWQSGDVSVGCVSAWRPGSTLSFPTGAQPNWRARRSFGPREYRAAGWRRRWARSVLSSIDATSAPLRETSFQGGQ